MVGVKHRHSIALSLVVTMQCKHIRIKKGVGIGIKEHNILSYESFFAPLPLKHNIMKLSS